MKISLSRLLSTTIIVASFELSFSSVFACGISKSEIIGTYSMSKGKGYQSNSLMIKNTGDNSELDFLLESFWAPRINDDGSSTSIGTFDGRAKMKGCLAKYIKPTTSGRYCKIYFLMEKKGRIKVTTFDDCEYGINAYPDGEYTKLGRAK